jgi:FAD/FMN-containing dehydrogenase
MKLYPLPAAQLTAWAAVPSLATGGHAAGPGAQAPGRRAHRLRGDGQVRAAAWSTKHMPQLRVPFVGDAAVPYCVLLENSDNESEDHARARFEALLETAFEDGCVTDAVVAENLTQAHQLWHIRENIPLAQAEEG